MSLFSTLSRWFTPTPAPSPETAAALVRIGELIGHSIAAEPDFERRLSGPVSHAQSYCARLVAELPPAVEVGRQQFASSPLVHALFASADDIAEMMGRSAALRDYLLQPVAWQQDECYALMAARRHDKHVLGVASQGNVLATDIPQSLLYFSEHTLVLPAPDAESAATVQRTAAFDSLLRTFATHLDTAREARKQIVVERELEKARLQSRRGERGLGREGLVRRIADLDERLRTHADALLPASILRTLADFLMNPEQALRLDPVELQVDRRGVMSRGEQPAGSDARSIRFTELSGQDRRQQVVLPVRIRCSEAREALARARELRDRLMVL